MSPWELVLLALAIFFAMNIGASGTAAAMAEAYGGGALSRRLGVLLAGTLAFIGATTAGGPVIHTVSHGILPAGSMTLGVSLVVITAACLSLFAANVLRTPLSTSEVTVGALVGAALILGGLNTANLRLIVMTWLLLPLMAGILAFAFARYAYPMCKHVLDQRPHRPRLQRTMTAVLVATGCYQAFAAGTNNVANAVGPLVGSGTLSAGVGAFMGGIGLALGAVLLGGRVLDTNGKKITRLCPIQGSFIAMTSGSLVLAASWMGIPVPLTQITTVAIVAMGWGKPGRNTLHVPVVRRIAGVWVFSPLVALLISLALLTATQGAGLGPDPGLAAPPP